MKQYTGKCFLGALFCVGCYFLAKPPILEWQANSCWNNATFQVLRNIRPLTVSFKGQRIKQGFENDDGSIYEVNDDGALNDFLKAYVDFLSITTVDTVNYKKSQLQSVADEIKQKRKIFHLESCKLREKSDLDFAYTLKKNAIDTATGTDPAHFLQDDIINEVLENASQAKKLFLENVEIKVHQEPSMLNPDGKALQLLGSVNQI